MKISEDGRVNRDPKAPLRYVGAEPGPDGLALAFQGEADCGCAGCAPVVRIHLSPDEAHVIMVALRAGLAFHKARWSKARREAQARREARGALEE